MTSLRSSEEPDSRTSSVGRKRGFNQLTAPDDNVITLEDDSPDEDFPKHEKRARYGQREDEDGHQVNSATESSQEITVISGSSSLHSSPRKESPGVSSEAVPVYTSGTADASIVVDAPLAWNKGVPVMIRTSFAGRPPQPQLSPQLVVDRQTLPSSEVETAATSNADANRFSPEQSLDEKENEMKNAVTTKSSSEQPCHVPPKLQAISGKRQAEILTMLPSSFGRANTKKEAEKIVRSLPEASRDLMPRKVAIPALEFTEKGRTFKLPKKLDTHLPADAVPLSKLCFRHPSPFSFTKWFLNGNLPLLEFMDYELLKGAFKEHLRLFYGHLPKKLRGIVASSHQVQGTKAELYCMRALSELKKLQVRRVAKKDGRGSKASTINNKALETTNSEESRRNSLKDFTMDLGGQNYDKTTKSPYPEPFFMGRLLGIKRAQSQVKELTKAGDERDSLDKSSDNGLILDTGFSGVSDISGVPDQMVPDQMATEPRDASESPYEIELMQRYHPFTEHQPFLRYCLVCSQSDHGAVDCPSMVCSVCGVRGIHFTGGCPKSQRCSKCNERGHQKPDCPEKLAATADDTLICGHCSSSKHLESACQFLWRSFKPGMLKSTRFVADIPIHCYACGATGHFGSDCGIRHSALSTEGYSWSISNWKRYVDPRSHNRALSAGKDFSLPHSTMGKKSFNIRGSAQNGNAPLQDDDENGPFIREKVGMLARPILRGKQQIKFDRVRHEENDYVSRNRPGAPTPDSRYQPARVPRAVPQQNAYAEARPWFTRPRDDSARYMRERSFSPPLRFHDERYAPWQAESYSRIDENPNSYRPYDRGIASSNVPLRPSEGRGNHNQGPPRGGPAEAGRSGAGAPRGKRQRNGKA